ncbi:hypothetical protein [Micromonospora psammae]|uniref:hypothetical protein n=1 Tax=Micromonospora sp. CPCC 205556 TaxID=3122398 RepID=UPI002FF101A4
MRSSALVDGAIAGAVGTTALNVVGYLDILVRARPPSSAPAASARRMAELARLDLGPEERAVNRHEGLGALLGYATGVAAGVAFAMLVKRRMPLTAATGLLGGGAMAMSDVAITALGVSDPRTWTRTDWLSDIVPHLAYGVAAAATWNRLRPPSGRGR